MLVVWLILDANLQIFQDCFVIVHKQHGSLFHNSLLNACSYCEPLLDAFPCRYNCYLASLMRLKCMKKPECSANAANSIPLRRGRESRRMIAKNNHIPPVPSTNTKSSKSIFIEATSRLHINYTPLFTESKLRSRVLTIEICEQ